MRKLIIATLVWATPLVAQAQLTSGNVNRICDPEFENCRARLIWYIQHETEGIDVAFSYMSDSRYVAALKKRHLEGLPIRILVNGEAALTKPNAAPVLKELAASGIPMRTKPVRPYLHWKMMIFHGIQRMQLSKANYTDDSFVPGFKQEGGSAKRGYFDEAIMFLNDPAVIDSFTTQFENYWVDTKLFVEYANSPDVPVRRYPVTPIDPAVNFHPHQDFNRRAVARMNQETIGIDVIEFRITYQPAVNALIAAHQRGVQVRIIVEPQSWGNPTINAHLLSVTRLIEAGVPVMYRIHPGLTHEGLIVLHGLQEAIFGSANLADSGMPEHNIFFAPGQGPVLYDGRSAFDWFQAQFQGKWENTAAFLPYASGK